MMPFGKLEGYDITDYSGGICTKTSIVYYKLFMERQCLCHHRGITA